MVIPMNKFARFISVLKIVLIHSSHDFDKNGKLDGLEMLVAMHHHNEKQNVNKQDSFQHDITLIDNVLHEDDVNNDGYLDYIEFISAKTRNPKNKIKKSFLFKVCLKNISYCSVRSHKNPKPLLNKM
ncbi:Multiple coagulation factor deficiency protein 2-like protein [Dinothrombium tinctorium]|uniref:Multiple coagulation factor deficiency protein 2-like protein n=1 Tax=Dinothrombium tinctorium TaxID=1965070 RepID=A0A443QZC9_9ACAR|nr:Multiple coagulation factor deficiency protein 2-like protein [Dinothrombium tinctorium]